MKFLKFKKQFYFPDGTFNPAGQDDIGGGCGQLWFIQDWMKNNPEKAKPTSGFGKPVVHTPKPFDI